MSSLRKLRTYIREEIADMSILTLYTWVFYLLLTVSGLICAGLTALGTFHYER